jgi:uncharacterized protein YcbX
VNLIQGDVIMATATPTVIGSVRSLWRYPVKSMLGEELDTAEVTERGLLGDRAYALVDASDGKVASAKQPRKWASLVTFQASYANSPRRGEPLPQVRITLPDGTTVSHDTPDCHARLSQACGREVSLQAAGLATATVELYWPDVEGLVLRETVRDFNLPEHTFFDSAPLHLLTTATLGRLSDLYPQGQFAVQRFRPNLVIEPATDTRDFLENAWVDRTLAIGATVRLHITGGCYRCVMTTLPQADLPPDAAILRTIAQHNEAHAGVYATMLQGGTIRSGDEVRLE